MRIPQQVWKLQHPHFNATINDSCPDIVFSKHEDIHNASHTTTKYVSPYIRHPSLYTILHTISKAPSKLASWSLHLSNSVLHWSTWVLYCSTCWFLTCSSLCRAPNCFWSSWFSAPCSSTLCCNSVFIRSMSVSFCFSPPDSFSLSKVHADLFDPFSPCQNHLYILVSVWRGGGGGAETLLEDWFQCQSINLMTFIDLIYLFTCFTIYNLPYIFNAHIVVSIT